MWTSHAIRALCGAACLLLLQTVNAGTIFTPMIDTFGDTITPDVDTWSMVADASGSISVEVFDESTGAALRIDGGPPVLTVAGGFVTVTLGGVVPGSTHTFTRERVAGPVAHYRPKFTGVTQLYITESQTSPNDRFNMPLPFGGGGIALGSNIELGFDTRFDTLPSVFADTTWFYKLDVGDTISWHGFFDDFPAGADAKLIRMFDANGVLQASAVVPPLLFLPGTTFIDTVLAGQEGFWSVKLSAPDVILPYAGHYLMDVEVTDAAGVRDADKSERHYLLPGSLLEVPEAPVPALIAIALVAGGVTRRMKNTRA